MQFRRWLGFAIVFAVMTANTAAWACGGGGSGSYRKPPRPGTSHAKAFSQVAQPSGQPETEPSKPQ